MHYKDLDMKLIVIVVICALVLMFMAKFAFEHYKIEKPLEDMLGADEKINTYKIEEKEGQKIIYIELKNIENLKTYHEDLIDRIDNIVKDEYTVKLINPRNSMQNYYYKMQFALYEAIETGNYTEMMDEIEKIADYYELDDCKVFISSQHIYLQFSKGDKSFYKVFDKVFDK